MINCFFLFFLDKELSQKTPGPKVLFFSEKQIKKIICPSDNEHSWQWLLHDKSKLIMPYDILHQGFDLPCNICPDSFSLQSCKK